MRKEQRLRRRKDFAEAYRRGRVYSNEFLIVRVRPNGEETSRFGFVASKAVGKAVTRNRVKRRLREAARRLPVDTGMDVVIGAKQRAAEATFEDLRRSLAALLRRAGVCREEAQGAS
jgi:ribonuclease P protein component